MQSVLISDRHIISQPALLRSLLRTVAIADQPAGYMQDRKLTGVNAQFRQFKSEATMLASDLANDVYWLAGQNEASLMACPSQPQFFSMPCPDYAAEKPNGLQFLQDNGWTRFKLIWRGKQLTPDTIADSINSEALVWQGPYDQPKANWWSAQALQCIWLAHQRLASMQNIQFETTLLASR